MTKKEAHTITGGLSNTHKMPGQSWGISPYRCVIGQKMAQVEGSVCSKCYAMMRHYRYLNVLKAHENRYEAMLRALEDPGFRKSYISAFVKQINREPHFRWFDAGDIQSVEHLRLICEICEATPTTEHWLPTRELPFLLGYLQKYGPLPENLVIRASSAMIDGDPPDKAWMREAGILTSGVSSQGDHDCPATEQGGVCGACRRCWDRDVPHVTYKLM